MRSRFLRAVPATAVLTLAAVLACADSTGPVMPQYPHSAATVRLISGDGQTGLVGATMPQPIVLEVLDSVGQPAWGRIVGVGFDTDTATTDRNGRATIIAKFSTTAGAFALNFSPGDQATSDPATHAITHATAIARPFQRVDTNAYGQIWYLTTSKLPRDQFFVAADTFGNVVPWPSTTWSLPAGWAVKGDTIVLPTPASPGRFTIGVQAGGVSAQKSVFLLDDMRQYRWKATWACGGGHPDAYYSDDSTYFTGTVHAMAYPGDPGHEEAQKADLPNVQPLLDGALTTVYPDGSSTTTTVSSLWVPGMWQTRVDTLDFWTDANSGTPTGKTVVQQPGALPSFIGGSWCNPGYYSRRWPVTLTAY